jgi:hypothetical protein
VDSSLSGSEVGEIWSSRLVSDGSDISFCGSDEEDISNEGSRISSFSCSILASNDKLLAGVEV